MRKIAAALAGALLLAGASPALGHVTADPDQAPADSWFRTALRISHGCAGSPTVAVRVKLPDGVLSVRPQLKPGWEISIIERKLDQPIEGPHGTITQVVDEIAWRGGPLPDAYFDEFGLSMRLPPEPGILYFPTVQECEEGVHRWIEIPTGDKEWDDLEEPAPFVTLTPKE